MLKVKRLSEVFPNNSFEEGIENSLFLGDIVIDEGYNLEVYFNTEGVYEEEMTSDGGSYFFHVDKELTYDKLLSIFEEDGSVKDSTLTINIIPSSYVTEYADCQKTPISKLLDNYEMKKTYPEIIKLIVIDEEILDKTGEEVQKEVYVRVNDEMKEIIDSEISGNKVMIHEVITTEGAVIPTNLIVNYA